MERCPIICQPDLLPKWKCPASFKTDSWVDSPLHLVGSLEILHLTSSCFSDNFCFLLLSVTWTLTDLVQGAGTNMPAFMSASRQKIFYCSYHSRLSEVVVKHFERCRYKCFTHYTAQDYLGTTQDFLHIVSIFWGH